MSRSFLLFLSLIILTLSFSSCEEESSDKGDPSYITIELQTIGDLSGGIFTEDKITLIRYIEDYAADDEDNALGSFSVYPDDGTENAGIAYLDIMGFANEDNHDDGIKQIYIRIPITELDGAGTYTFDVGNTDHVIFSIKIQSDYGLWLTGASEHYTEPETSMTVIIEEISDERIKGSYTANLESYTCTENTNGSLSFTRNDEMSDTNQPLVNGKFDVFRMD